MSAGVGLDLEAGTGVTLADVLEKAIAEAHDPVVNAADPLFFFNPSSSARLAVEKALASRPTLVVAVDFLFWFGYGEVKDEESRLVRLEEGFRLLERFSCPCVAGDLPDMSAAVGKMLAAAQVPRPETLVRLNERIRAWAKGRPGVAVVGLAELVKKLRANEEFTMGRRAIPAGSTRALLQKDDLHTTLQGSAWIAVLALAKAAELRKEKGPIGAWIDDVPKIVEAVRAAAARKRSSGGGPAAAPAPPSPTASASPSAARRSGRPCRS